MTINLKIVHRVVAVLAGGGPAVTEPVAHAFVQDLRAQAQKAAAIVAQITGLDDAAREAAKTEIFVVDRPTWAAAAAGSMREMIHQDNDPLNTIEMSLVLSIASSRILGQFDPYSAARGRLYLIAPNVASFRQSYDLDRRDLSLWVSVHEMTHAFQFAAAPWLKDLIIDLARDAFEHEDDDGIEETLEKVQAVMSLLEGHAEYVMNNVPRRRMPGRDRIVQAMKDRRTPKNRLIGELSKRVSLDIKAKQYTGGEKFVDTVVARKDMTFFNKVWESAENLPSPAELEDARAWIERMS